MGLHSFSDSFIVIFIIHSLFETGLKVHMASSFTMSATPALLFTCDPNGVLYTGSYHLMCLLLQCQFVYSEFPVLLVRADSRLPCDQQV